MKRPAARTTKKPMVETSPEALDAVDMSPGLAPPTPADQSKYINSLIQAGTNPPPPSGGGGGFGGGPLNITAPGAASTPALNMTGAPFTGGGGTTTVPLLYLNSGTNQPTNLNNAGTIFGINAPAGYSGNYFDFRGNGAASTSFSLTATGALYAANVISSPVGVNVGTSQAIINNVGSLQLRNSAANNAGMVQWWSAVTATAGTCDTSLYRYGVGILAVGGSTNVGVTGDNGSLRCLLVNTGQITQPARATGQTASIVGTPIVTDGAANLPAGLYRVTYYINVTAAGTAGTVQFLIGYTDDAGSKTQTGTSVSLTTLGNMASGVMVLYTTGAAQVLYMATVAGATGTPTYSLTLQVERLM
jgi:hypothetical protein